MFVLHSLIPINLTSACILSNFSNICLLLELLGLGNLGEGKLFNFRSSVLLSISLESISINSLSFTEKGLLKTKIQRIGERVFKFN